MGISKTKCLVAVLALLVALGGIYTFAFAKTYAEELKAAPGNSLKITSVKVKIKGKYREKIMWKDRNKHIKAEYYEVTVRKAQKKLYSLKTKKTYHINKRPISPKHKYTVTAFYKKDSISHKPIKTENVGLRFEVLGTKDDLRGRLTWKVAEGYQKPEYYEVTVRHADGTETKHKTRNNYYEDEKSFAFKDVPSEYTVRAFYDGGASYTEISSDDGSVDYRAEFDKKQNEYIKESDDARKFALEVFRLTNMERKKAGLSELRWDESLYESACIRAREINEKFSHIRPDGTSYNTAFPYLVSENIAEGYNTSEEVVKGWMSSTKGHRENILDPAHKKMCAAAYLQGVNKVFALQIFY